MTLANIKNKYGIGALELNTAKDKAGVETEWMRHWDNDNRVAVSLHKELVAKIQANPGMTNLGVQETRLTAESGKAYHAVRIIAYTEAEITL